MLRRKKNLALISGYFEMYLPAFYFMILHENRLCMINDKLCSQKSVPSSMLIFSFGIISKIAMNGSAEKS